MGTDINKYFKFNTKKYKPENVIPLVIDGIFKGIAKAVNGIPRYMNNAYHNRNSEKSLWRRFLIWFEKEMNK